MSFTALAPRLYPLRKPKGFDPPVQRWSVALPRRVDTLFVGVYGVQGPDLPALEASGFFDFVEAAFERDDGPTAIDHARHVDDEGQLNHIVTAYWVDAEARRTWQASTAVTSFWTNPARTVGDCGFFRECLAVPADRLETLYWPDYLAALSASDDVGFYPTPYCGYYGSMRDRIALAAHEELASPLPGLPQPSPPHGKGRRLRVEPPENLAIIRSATFWGNCDDEQMDDFEAKLRRPLEGGMDYLRRHAVEASCCSMRYQHSVDAGGSALPEAHALGVFLSLAHLEAWAERHASHHGIFSAATARYKKYGNRNQLRTWHEVYVLPADDQVFEYINCSPRTGLLPWFPPIEL